MSKDLTLSVFVDESGHLPLVGDVSRFYIISFVVHDQQTRIDDNIRKLDEALSRLGLDDHCFHAGPLIRREDFYADMNWELRCRIFSAMMAFTRQTEFRYRSICIDKRFISSERQIIAQLKVGASDFLNAIKSFVEPDHRFKVYYDCGQSAVTNLIHESMNATFGHEWEFAQNVRPRDYKLFQVADLVSTVSLMDCKLRTKLGLTKSEEKFFGGARNFMRNVLKPILRKQI